MRRVVVFLVLLASLLSTSMQYARAEQPDQNKIQDRIEFLTMWKMMEALDLDKSTAEKILEVRKNFLSQRKTLLASLQENFQNLQQTLKDTPRGKENEKELTGLLTQIREKRKRLETLDDELYEHISQVLSVRQQAELVLFLRDFRREMRALMPPPPPPPHRGPGGLPPPFDHGMESTFDHGMEPPFPRGDSVEGPGGGGPPRKPRK
ncbi:MAG: hypothetical protein HY912_15475 [Desulfomonile tiedjei]|uniref:Periplasmic heavy metal sensor n=1 Tax=Desulfomonile tiedjei TaxID=2358 RepID=A0A9D6Z4T8_9BACT|nr:hypothetical protein [Desulfomonile tiedjei]